MALTPEDVVNKRFNPTKFREGYDQDEVDDFLDEVVVELRRLNQENEELRQRLVAGESRIVELQRAASTPVAAPAGAPLPVAAPTPEQPAFAPSGFDANSMDPGNTNNLLQLARRLHEEHVREGMEKRDALIAEGHATAARLVAEAEQGARSQVDALQQERSELERRIDELRIFEREYRSKLKGYIEGQLKELETTNALTAGSSVATGGQPTVSGPAPTSAPTYVPAPDVYSQPAGGYGQPAPADYGQPAPAGYGQPAGQPDYSAYQQPTEYPGFGSQS